MRRGFNYRAANIAPTKYCRTAIQSNGPSVKLQLESIQAKAFIVGKEKGGNKKHASAGCQSRKEAKLFEQ